MYKLSLFLVIMLPLFLSCNKSVEPPNVTTYAFSSGTVWTYRGESSIYNFRATEPGVTFRDTSYAWAGEVRALGNTILSGSVTTSRVSASETLQGVQPTENYYLLQNDTLYLYAWKFGGSSPILPKRTSPYLFNYRGRSHSTIEELYGDLEHQRFLGLPTSSESLYYSENPPRVLVFPLHTGMEWTFNSIDSIEIKKKVIGTESITTNAGVFSTFVIQWSGAFLDSAIVEKEYISGHGLIKRTYLVKDVLISSLVYPDGFGLVDVKLEYVLSSLNVP